MLREDSCCLQTFRKWREDRKTDKEKKEAEAEAERKRKGNLTGREIFMEVVPAACVSMEKLPQAGPAHFLAGPWTCPASHHSYL